MFSNFSVLLITYEALYGLTPQYISDLLSLYDPAHTLRSSDRGLLSVSGPRLKTKGDKAFEIRAPRIWNILPEEIRQAESVLILVFFFLFYGFYYVIFYVALLVLSFLLCVCF